MDGKKISVGVLGATGFTGGELVEWLLRHPRVEIAWLGSESQPGTDYCEVYPRFHGLLSRESRTLRTLAEVSQTAPDAVFSCLPHAASAAAVLPFLKNGKTVVIDLSADFRLGSRELYEKVYGTAHPAPELLAEAVYGLCEWRPRDIAGKKLIANPGCYPTSVLLPLLPLLQKKLIAPRDLIIDAKSGVSGAGKKPTETTHYVNSNESLAAYKVGDQHRHRSEIGEQLEGAAGAAADFLFTPHLIPMERGILSTIYCRLLPGADEEKVNAALEEAYRDSVFVTVRRDFPRTGDVRGTNQCHMKAYVPKGGDRLIVVSVLDNMVKGASGQALQNMNLALGLPEAMGLR